MPHVLVLRAHVNHLDRVATNTLGTFLLRSGVSFFTLIKMDFWGDGYCGANATRYEGVNDHVLKGVTKHMYQDCSEIYPYR